MSTGTIDFIDDPIEVIFNKSPRLEKTPQCPDAFYWREMTYYIIEVISEWCDFQRRGHMDNNMRPEHAARAKLKGSWGVGRFYFRIREKGGRIFELYYDRSPSSVDDRKGNWFLLKEIKRD